VKNIRTQVILFVLLVASAASVTAQPAPRTPTAPSNAGVAFKVSTFGFGADVAVPLSPKTNIRGGFGTYGLSHDFEDDGLTLAAKFSLRALTASFDWFPFAGGFHVSPGVVLYNGNSVKGTVTVPGGRSFSLGDDEVVSNPANPIAGHFEVGFANVAPSLTVGWGNIVPRGNRRWSIPFEIGVAYSRSPKYAMSLSGSGCAFNGTNCRNIATDPILQRDLADEQDQMNSDLSPLKILPILSLGFSYKF
jgi:hypothetical protein